MFLNLAIFLLVAALVIAVAKPKSRTQVWIYSILTPVVLSVIYALSVAMSSDSQMPLSYQLGGLIGGNAPSILITIITLFYCLKKKVENKDNYKYPKVIFIVIAVCAIIGCIQLYMSYRSHKVLEQYIEMKSNGKIDSQSSKKAESVKSNAIIDDDKNPVTKKIRAEMIDAAQSYNEKLPEDLGYGMTMIKCAIEEYSMVYTIQWKGMNPSDFTDDAITDIRNTCIEGLKEDQKSPIMKAMLERMKDYGYDFLYRYVNENGEELCSVNISPYDI